MVHRRLFYIYLLNVPSFSSRYFNKTKLTSRLGMLALSLEILYHMPKQLNMRFWSENANILQYTSYLHRRHYYWRH